MITKLHRHVRIVTNTTTTPANASCLLSQIVIACANAGTAWTIKIQDKASTPAILLPATTLALGAPAVIRFHDAVPMDGGIDIITAGTTEGVVNVWISYGKQETG